MKTLRTLLSEMAPEGPYKSAYYERKHFIIKDAKGIVRTVSDGQQPSDGIKHLSLRDARDHLKRNGFALNTNEEGVPANCVGGGQVAGVGIGPQGEPGFYKKRKKRRFEYVKERPSKER